MLARMFDRVFHTPWTSWEDIPRWCRLALISIKWACILVVAVFIFLVVLGVLNMPYIDDYSPGESFPY